jgi:hypothetical protein
MGLYAIIRERIRVVIVELAALVDYIIVKNFRCSLHFATSCYS